MLDDEEAREDLVQEDEQRILGINGEGGRIIKRGTSASPPHPPKVSRKRGERITTTTVNTSRRRTTTFSLAHKPR